MAVIAFLGLGNMGGRMAANLVAKGHEVRGFDVFPAAADAAHERGVPIASSNTSAVAGAEFVITMLPAGSYVLEAWHEILGVAAEGALLIDCSTIDVPSARAVHEAARAKGFDSLDAPVSGGVGGAEAGTLTFMVGGLAEPFKRGEPILAAMGKRIVHCGGPGNGQVAKICNNMVLGVTMAATAEAFVMGERLGLDAQSLFDVLSTSSGQSWSVTTYCPVPGPVPTSPANRDYAPGFATALMSKDMELARAAAATAGVATTLGRAAADLYLDKIRASGSADDFSAIIRHIRTLAP